MRPVDLRPDMVLGDYLLVRRLGRGGQAEVWLALWVGAPQDAPLQVAVKAAEPNRSHRRRLGREGDVLHELNHANIVGLIDRHVEPEPAPAEERDETDGDPPPPYIVLDYVEGEDLRKVIEGSRGVADLLGLGETDSHEEVALRWVRLMAPVLHALAACLNRKLLHRDVKPQNIILTSRDGAQRLVLVDFGIASSVLGAGLTDDGRRLGTLAYRTEWSTWISLANADWKRAMLCGDLYGFGVTLCALIAGRLPGERCKPRDVGGQTRDVVVARPALCDEVVGDGRLPAWLRQLCDRTTRVDLAEMWTAQEALAYINHHLGLEQEIPEPPDFDETDLETFFDPSTIDPSTIDPSTIAPPAPVEPPPWKGSDPDPRPPPWDGPTWASLIYATSGLTALGIALYLVSLGLPHWMPS